VIWDIDGGGGGELATPLTVDDTDSPDPVISIHTFHNNNVHKVIIHLPSVTSS
jgi:hypothetical protein